MDDDNDYWSKDDIKLLIDGFKSHDLLWNTKNVGYMKRAQRDRAMKAISMKINGKGMSEVPSFVNSP